MAASPSMLSSHPSAVVPISDVPDVLGVGVDDAASLIAGWAAEGVVEIWADHPDGPAAVLSSSEANRLGLALVEVERRGGEDPVLRWAPTPVATKSDKIRGRAGVVRESDVAAGQTRRGDPVVGLDAFPDPKAPDPTSDTEEPPARRENGKQKGEPRWGPKTILGRKPTVFLGLGHAWPVARMSGSCGVCRGLELKPGRYCTVCDHAGDDHLLPPVSQRELKLGTLADDGLGGGRGRVPTQKVDAVWKKLAASGRAKKGSKAGKGKVKGKRQGAGAR